mmetsp:Transcript_26372/g.81135  ORF Transcript_26372/g.81135 Transcript_26372/m.81135 type:complete len:559 (-) Transcript_26372:17-1693(-)
MISRRKEEGRLGLLLGGGVEGVVGGGLHLGAVLEREVLRQDAADLVAHLGLGALPVDDAGGGHGEDDAEADQEDGPPGDAAARRRVGGILFGLFVDGDLAAVVARGDAVLVGLGEANVRETVAGPGLVAVGEAFADGVQDVGRVDGADDAFVVDDALGDLVDGVAVEFVDLGVQNRIGDVVLEADAARLRHALRHRLFVHGRLLHGRRDALRGSEVVAAAGVAHARLRERGDVVPPLGTEAAVVLWGLLAAVQSPDARPSQILGDDVGAGDARLKFAVGVRRAVAAVVRAQIGAAARAPAAVVGAVVRVEVRREELVLAERHSGVFEGLHEIRRDVVDGRRPQRPFHSFVRVGDRVLERRLHLQIRRGRRRTRHGVVAAVQIMLYDVGVRLLHENRRNRHRTSGPVVRHDRSLLRARLRREARARAVVAETHVVRDHERRSAQPLRVLGLRDERAVAPVDHQNVRRHPTSARKAALRRRVGLAQRVRRVVQLLRDHLVVRRLPELRLVMPVPVWLAEVRGDLDVEDGGGVLGARPEDDEEEAAAGRHVRQEPETLLPS